MHYNQVVPRADLDVIMVAPKAPGHTVRSEYLKGGVPTLIADLPGQVRQGPTSPFPTCSNGGTKGRRDRDRLREETETDLFGEQAAVWRHVELVKMGFETLIEAGLCPGDGLLQCLHELAIVDLMYEGGFANMNYSISNNAEYGEYVTGS